MVFAGWDYSAPEDQPIYTVLLDDLDILKWVVWGQVCFFFFWQTLVPYLDVSLLSKEEGESVHVHRRGIARAFCPKQTSCTSSIQRSHLIPVKTSEFKVNIIGMIINRLSVSIIPYHLLSLAWSVAISKTQIGGTYHLQGYDIEDLCNMYIWLYTYLRLYILYIRLYI